MKEFKEKALAELVRCPRCEALAGDPCSFGQYVPTLAKQLAWEHTQDDPDIQAIYISPDDTEVRLVEVTSKVPANGEVLPFRFAADAARGLPFRSLVVLIHPTDWESRGSLDWPIELNPDAFVQIYPWGRDPPLIFHSDRLNMAQLGHRSLHLIRGESWDVEFTKRGPMRENDTERHFAAFTTTHRPFPTGEYHEAWPISASGSGETPDEATGALVEELLKERSETASLLGAIDGALATLKPGVPAGLPDS